MRNANMTMNPTSFEVLAGTKVTNEEPHIGVRFNIHQGYANMLDSITFPITGEDALTLGALLIAQADALAGRPVRNWDAL